MCRRISNNYITHTNCNIYNIESVFVGWKYNTVSKKIISQFKYKCSYRLSAIISDLLIKRLDETNFMKSVDPSSILIPVPIHQEHLSKRGFNQSLLIANNISKEFNLRVVNNVLYRKGDSRYQAKLSVEERYKLKDVFYLKNKISNKNILILDDVLTTGATLNSVAKTLKGKQIKAITLFRGKPLYR